MRFPLAFGFCILSMPLVNAQVRGVAGAPVLPHPAGALGGSFLSPVISRPLGGVALPSFPGHPSAAAQKSRKAAATTSHYVGPVDYVPNAFDSTPYDSSTWAPPEAPVERAPSRTPVVINQYFSSRENTAPVGWQPPVEEPVLIPGGPVGTPENYYLIAYKDHTIYSALAYWVEGDTLHYVTTQNTHNQASLSLIDIDRSTKLNADRAAPFTIAGK